jgi:hypothetical protein
MAFIRKDGYKFSETAFGVYLADKKKRDSKYGLVITFFAFLFGVPVLYLIFNLVWKAIKWVLSIG